ncbi:MAG: riboflavin kinase [Bacteroidales bacterium]|jgi:riboflavin kinase/FMN adenylyltransferase|nr:riboflavin kinase [Bacteroidales bacterium]
MHKIYNGKVIRGLGKGKSYGFPTINILLNNNELNINCGVYVAEVKVNNQTFKGMLYVGTRPTFDLLETTIEIHILEFNEVIYNQDVSFQILYKIRNEIKFSNTKALVKQLHQDRKMVYNY